MSSLFSSRTALVLVRPSRRVCPSHPSEVMVGRTSVSRVATTLPYVHPTVTVVGPRRRRRTQDQRETVGPKDVGTGRQ